MEEPFLASSLQPPAATRPTGGRYAPWVLLDSRAYFAVHENGTTAEAVTSTGRTIKVTFCLADPPAISHFCVHGPDFQRKDFRTEPRVLFSDKDLVLLRFSFNVGPRSTRRDSDLAEYFIYKAGRGQPPSLTPIPRDRPGTINSLHICVLPFIHDGGFLLADLFMSKHCTDYELHVFSSRTGRWTTRPLQLKIPPGVREEDLPSPFIDKAIALGGGTLGWVDLCRGIVSCNVFDKNPVLSFIPIPRLGDCNEQRCTRDPRQVRDVTCCNGYIKFVKLDLQSKQEEPNRSVDCDGWELRTCYRHTSWDYWLEGHTVNIDDIPADDLDSGTGLPWALGSMITAYPILGIGGHDVVYMMSKATLLDNNAWMIGVDLGKKTVDALVQVPSERVRYFNPKLLTCEFSEYLNATPSRSSTELLNHAPYRAQNYHLSRDCTTEVNLPPQQENNIYYNESLYGHIDTAHQGYVDDQHLSPWSANLPQPLRPNLTSRRSGWGCLNLVNTQLMDPVAVVDTDGEELLLPLWPSGQPHPSPPCGSTWSYRLL